MTRISIYRGEVVIEALEALGGEANTDAIAAQGGIEPLGSLVTCGQLSVAGYIRKCEKCNKRGNPRWRLPVVGEEGYSI